MSSIVSATKKGDIKEVQKILRERKYTQKKLKEAIALSDKLRDPNHIFNTLDTSSSSKNNRYKKIHDILTVHLTLEQRSKREKENIDNTHIVANIVGYMGGRRKTRRKYRKNKKKKTLKHK